MAKKPPKAPPASKLRTEFQKALRKAGLRPLNINLSMSIPEHDKEFQHFIGTLEKFCKDNALNRSKLIRDILMNNKDSILTAEEYKALHGRLPMYLKGVR